MSENEKRLIQIIRDSEDPAMALVLAMQIILDYLGDEERTMLE